MIPTQTTISAPITMRARCRVSIVSKVGVSSTSTRFSPFGSSSAGLFFGLAGLALVAEDFDLAGSLGAGDGDVLVLRGFLLLRLLDR